MCRRLYDVQLAENIFGGHLQRSGTQSSRLRNINSMPCVILQQLEIHQNFLSFFIITVQEWFLAFGL